MPFGIGTAFKVAGVAGWRDMAEAPLGGVGQLQPRGQANGSYRVPYFMPSRIVTMQFIIEAMPGPEFEAALTALETATQPGFGEVPLTIQVNGISTTATGNVTSRIIPTGLEFLAGFSAAQIELTCTDVRRFGSALMTPPIHLPSSTGGLTWPITWPISWPSTVATGSASLVNDGTATGPVTFRVHGPVTAPQIVHVETGLTLAFSSALTVAAGDWLDIDCEARTVLYNGQSSRNAMLISRGWPGFTKGANTFFFNAGSYSPDAYLQVTATPAFI
jgi:hypothetical protein